MRPSLLLSASLAAFAAVAGETDLLQAPVLLRGSGFCATTGYQTTVTTNYYSAINDGDDGTYWEPMEAKGPHFIEMLWNQPVTAHGARLLADGIGVAVLYRWSRGRWVPVAKAFDADGRATFPAAKSDRWRIRVGRVTGKPKIRTFNLFGPQQYVLPREIPEGLEPGQVACDGVSVPAKTFRPGETVEVSFRVSAAEKTAPFGLMLELSDREALEERRDDRSDFCSGRWAARPDANGRVTVRMELPPWTPQGRNDILVFALADGSGREIRVKDPVLGSVEVGRPDFPAMLEPVESVRVGDNAAGQRGFVINGKWHPAFFNRYYGNPTPERLAATAETGLRILYWQNREPFPIEDEGTMQRRLAWFDRRIRMALRVNPENYFILSQRAKADSRAWLDAHPDELMLLENGERNPERLVSFGSELYLRESEEFLTRLAAFVARQPYAGRVIGYHLWTCTKNDGFIGGAMSNRKAPSRAQFVFGDYNPGALRLFREFLRTKYRGDVSALRLAWHDPKVSFEDALVRQADVLCEDVPGTVFRDPVRSRPAIDYIEFFPMMLSRYYRRTAAAVKRATDGKALVLVHYGAVKHALCFNWAEQLQSGNNDLETVLDDPNIDVYVQAQPYDMREAGNGMFAYQPVRSIDLHGRLFLFDHDPRTLGAGVLRYGRHRSQYEGAAVFARDYGYQWIENSGAWISDMSLVPWGRFDDYRLPWFTMPEVSRPIRETIAKLGAQKTPRKSAAEIAVVLSLNSPRYEDACRANPHYKGLVCDLMMRKGFPFLGAPHDVILSGDLCRKGASDYRLYMFLNPTYLTPAERVAVEGLKRDGKTLMWFYAPGYVTDDGFSLEAARRLSGIDLKIKPGVTEIPELVYESGSPLSEGLGGRKLTCVTWDSIAELCPRALSPVFYADDPAVCPAGRYADGTVAYGVRDFGSWKSVWCGVPNFGLQELVNLARFAGVHLYAQAPVVLDADNRMMMVHNGYAGRKTIDIRLPRPARVSDLLTGEGVADGTAFTLTLDAPETRLLGMDYR